MARDPLAILWRLRDAAVTAAGQDLAQARARAAREAERLAAHRDAMRREQNEASGELVADFAIWLPAARRQAERLRAGLATEEARVERLRQGLADRKIEAEAVAKAMQRQAAAAALHQTRREQAAMDEAAGRRSVSL